MYESASPHALGVTGVGLKPGADDKAANDTEDDPGGRQGRFGRCVSPTCLNSLRSSLPVLSFSRNFAE